LLSFLWARVAPALSTVASRPGAHLAAACALSGAVAAIIFSAAYADGMAVGGCTGTGGSVSCVVRWGEAGDPYIRKVPEPTDELERKRAVERDKKWEQRCRPTIVQDHYGVPRYRYGAAGCEFGIIE